MKEKRPLKQKGSKIEIFETLTFDKFGGFQTPHSNPLIWAYKLSYPSIGSPKGL